MGEVDSIKGPALFQLLVITISMFAIALAGSSAADPVYLYGDQVTVKVFPTGSFVVDPQDFPSRFYDSSSSFWSFNIDGAVTTTIDALTGLEITQA